MTHKMILSGNNGFGRTHLLNTTPGIDLVAEGNVLPGQDGAANGYRVAGLPGETWMTTSCWLSAARTVSPGWAAR